MDDRFLLRIAVLSWPAKSARLFPFELLEASEEADSRMVGAPRTTRTEFSSHLDAGQDTHNALGLSYRARSASRLTAEFSGRGLTCQHAGAPAPIGRRHLSPAAEHFMVHGPLQRFVRRRSDTLSREPLRRRKGDGHSFVSWSMKAAKNSPTIARAAMEAPAS